MSKFQTLALTILYSSVFLITSCSKDDDSVQPAAAALTVNTVTDLDGSKSNVYYSLSNNAVCYRCRYSQH